MVYLKKKNKAKEEKLEAQSRSRESAVLQIHTVLWSDSSPPHQESKRKLNSYRRLFDSIRPAETPLMESQASVTKLVLCSRMAHSFHTGICFMFYRQTLIFQRVQLKRFL